MLPPRKSCCSAKTDKLFDDVELFVLAAGGTHPRHLRPPSEPIADGCDFCGEDGCNLAPTDRPSVCIGYICSELARELSARGDGRRIVEMIAQMEDLRRILLDNAAD